MADTDLLPPNATAIERALAYVANQRIDLINTPLRDLWDAQACPAELLPWLAYAYGVDDWSSDWPEAERRAAIQAALGIHQHRGTTSAMRQALAVRGISMQVQEWWQQSPQGDPYTYRLLLSINQTGFSATDFSDLLIASDRAKNVRSHMTELRPTVNSSGTVYAAGISSMGSNTTVTDFYAARLVLNPNIIILT